MAARTLTILVAEDDRGIQQLLETILRREGFLVQCVSDGEEALQRCSVRPLIYDAILLDFAMPRVSGADVIRELTEAKRPDVLSRIIIITAASAKDVANLNEFALLRKPFDINLLVAAIWRVAGPRDGVVPAEVAARSVAEA